MKYLVLLKEISNSIKMSRDYRFMVSRDFYAFRIKKELYKNVFCHPFSAFITFCRTHKTGIFVAATLQSIRSPSSHRSFNKSPCLRFFMMYSFTVYNIIYLASKTIEHVHNSLYFNFIFLAGLIFIVTS